MHEGEEWPGDVPERAAHREEGGQVGNTGVSNLLSSGQRRNHPVYQRFSGLTGDLWNHVLQVLNQQTCGFTGDSWTGEFTV